jgi:hypothetical protein
MVTNPSVERIIAEATGKTEFDAGWEIARIQTNDLFGSKTGI